jgi:hypothetical protein
MDSIAPAALALGAGSPDSGPRRKKVGRRFRKYLVLKFNIEEEYAAHKTCPRRRRRAGAARRLPAAALAAEVEQNKEQLQYMYRARAVDNTYLYIDALLTFSAKPTQRESKAEMGEAATHSRVL